MNLRKFAAAAVAAAQLAVGFTAMPAQAEESLLSLTYDSATMTDANGAVYPTTDTQIELKNYGFSYDYSNIYGLRKIASVNYIGETGFRFSSRPASAKKSADLATLTFENDTMNNKPSLSGGGYVYESEFMIQVKETSAQLQLTFNGEKADGTSANIAKVTFTPPSTILNSGINTGKVCAVNALGSQVGNAGDIRITSATSSDWCGQLLYIKVQLDLTNNRYSLWLVPRKTEGGEYAEIPASDEYLLVKDAPMNASGITKFAGITYNLANYAYGNAVWIKNINVNEYVPEVIEATPSPTPYVRDDGTKLKFAVLSDFQYGRA